LTLTVVIGISACSNDDGTVIYTFGGAKKQIRQPDDYRPDSALVRDFTDIFSFSLVEQNSPKENVSVNKEVNSLVSLKFKLRSSLG